MTKDYSEDGLTWTVRPTKDVVYIRETEDFNQGWRRELIETLVIRSVFNGSRIEYSTDDGYSWQPLRLSTHNPDNAARIYTMMQRKYQVRALKINQVGQPKVTDPSTSNSSFFRSANIANQQQSSRPVRREISHKYIYRNDNGDYYFTDVRQQSDELIVTLERLTYFDMKTPNANEETFTEAGQVRNKSALRVRGFVFKMGLASTYPAIQHWWQVLQQSDPNFNPQDYTVFKCARLFDNEMNEFFYGLGPTIGVLGGKYIVGWSNRFKLGDTWIIPAKFATEAANRIRAKGGRISLLDPNEKEQEANIKRDIKFESREVNPAYIMQIRLGLEELIRVGKAEDIMDMLIQTIDFRNKCVDELKELNKTIEKARDKVKEEVSGQRPA